MLELMLAGNNVTIVPGSGPGNKKLLAGDKTNGWFGVQMATDLPAASVIASAVGLTATLPQNTTYPLRWMKAVLDGKFIFFPTAPFNNYTLTQLYNAGAVFGMDSNGLVTPTGLTPTNQLKIVTFKDLTGKDWAFRIRLIGTSNPINPTSTSLSSTQAQTCEMFNLFSHVTTNVTPLDGKSWDSLVIGRDIYNDRFHGRTLLGNQVCTRAPSYGWSTYYWESISNSYGWWPLLEVLDPDVDIIPPMDVSAIMPGDVPVAALPTAVYNKLAPSELTMAGQSERAAVVGSGTTDAVQLTPPTLIFENHDERPAHIKK